jgi:sugar phosphate permease
MRLRFFYGWIMVAVTFVTMAISVNARTSFSLFFPPVIDEFGWVRGITAGAFSFGFNRRRGLAIGLAFAGIGIGSITLLPWVQHMIEQNGWRTACTAMGIVVLVVLAPINLLLRKRPEDIGLRPDGDAAYRKGAAEPGPVV